MSETVAFQPAGLGLKGACYAYNPFTGWSERLAPGAAHSQMLPQHSSSYIEVAPLGLSGIAFLGDAGKFVGTGKQRIKSIEERPGVLVATVLFAKGEKGVTLHGFAPKAPRSGAGKVLWDPTTEHFSLAVNAKGKSQVRVALSLL